MNDAHGLPLTVNADGTLDANDQLNRVGMCLAAHTLPEDKHTLFVNALLGGLQVRAGVYSRFIGGNARTVSADQLIPVLAYWVSVRNYSQSQLMYEAMCERGGFAQNVEDGLGGSTREKVPDFMWLRAMPLFARIGPSYTIMWDWYLIILVLGDWVYRLFGRDPVDINCTLVTLVTCYYHQPTLTSRLACWLWPRLRPQIYADLQRYHREDAGGNPWIAEYWEKHIRRVFSK